MSQRLRQAIDERTVVVDRRLEALSAQIDALETSFAQQKQQVLKEIEDRGEQLSVMLHEFKNAFEKDREERLEREALIIKQLTDHEHEVEQQFVQGAVRKGGIMWV